MAIRWRFLDEKVSQKCGLPLTTQHMQADPPLPRPASNPCIWMPACDLSTSSHPPSPFTLTAAGRQQGGALLHALHEVQGRVPVRHPGCGLMSSNPSEAGTRMACQRMARRGPTAFLHARSNAVYHADGCTPAHSAAHPAAPCWPYRMPNGRWRAQFTHRNKVIQIGMFDSEEEVRGVPVDWMHSTDCRLFCSVGSRHVVVVCCSYTWPPAEQQPTVH